MMINLLIKKVNEVCNCKNKSELINTTVNLPDLDRVKVYTNEYMNIEQPVKNTDEKDADENEDIVENIDAYFKELYLQYLDNMSELENTKISQQLSNIRSKKHD